MALPLGKLTIIIGAGIVGSVLAKEGRVSEVSNFFSSALKVVFKHIRQDDPPSTDKPRNDALLAQVNSLRQELQMLASSRSVTIVTGGSRSGASSYAMPVVVVGIVGYGYIWWKGWKLSDMMFTTRRNLSEACTTIAKQLDKVHLSISSTKRHLSSRIDRVDNNLDQCAELNVATRDEVSNLRGDLRDFGVDVESVHRAVECLETKIGRIEGKQDLTNRGVYQLCEFVHKLEERKQPDLIQATPSSSSRPALEPPVVTSTPRTLSLPPKILELEPSSQSSANKSPKVSEPLKTAAFAPTGLKELQGISEVSRATDVGVPNETHVGDGSNSDTSSSRFGFRLPSFSASFLTRTHSATYSFK